MSFYFCTDISAPTLAADDTGANNPRIGYENLATVSNTTVTSANADHPLVNMLTPSTYDYWLATSDAVQNIDVDFSPGTTQTWNYIAICGHNFHEGTGVDVTVQRKALSGDPWTTLKTITTIIGAEPIVVHFADTTNDFCRVVLTAATGNIARVANFMIGKMLILPRRVYVGHTPIDLGRSAKVSIAQSENGEYLGHVVRSIMKTTEIDLKNISETFYRDYIVPFAIHAESKPFIWAWRPTKYDDEVAYAWTNGDLKPANLSNGRVEFSLNIIAKNYT